MVARSKALSSIGWAIVQAWGGRLITFALLVIWARILTPYEFGLVSTCVLIQYVIVLFAEFGFGDAMIQREDSQAHDLNLPFFTSVTASTALALGTWWYADAIELLLKTEGLAHVLRIFCFIAPLTTIMEFQEILYRRALEFKRLAMRVFIANCAGGAVALTLAWYGYGIWSFVAQSFVATLTSIVWLWARPVWLPSLSIAFDSFFTMARFSVSVFASRLLEFVSVRTVEFLILVMHGPVAFGLYSVGARLYQTLMQLVTSAVSGVALSLLARVAADIQRLRDLFFSSLRAVAMFGAPIFIGLGAISPELIEVLFGPRWNSAAALSTPLLYLGGLQCIQYLNSSYLTAIGKPAPMLGLNVLKTVFTLIALALSFNASAYVMVLLLVIAQAAIAPFNYWVTSRNLGVPLARIGKELFPILASLALGILAVSLARPWLISLAAFPRGVILGGAFTIGYAASVLIMARGQLEASIGFLLGREFSLRRGQS